MSRVRDFLEERTGLPGALDRWLAEPATPRLADLAESASDIAPTTLGADTLMEFDVHGTG